MSMVIDAAKGIEARTRKLFQICRCATFPCPPSSTRWTARRATSILLDGSRRRWRSTPRPMTWPIGRGPGFSGTYDAARQRCAAARRPRRAKAVAAHRRHRRSRHAMPNSMSAALGWIELVSRGLQAVRSRAGVPRRPSDAVFFGSALRNFGVAICWTAWRFAPPPPGLKAPICAGRAPEPRTTASCSRSRPTWIRTIATDRLRAALSGRLARGMKAKLVRTGKNMSALSPRVLLRAGSRDRRRGLCRRHHRHSQSRHPAARRHPDRGRGHRFRRRAEFRPEIIRRVGRSPMR